MAQPEGRCVDDPALYEWLALRRIAGGEIAKSAGAYFDQGQQVPCYLIEVFDRLIWTGLLSVADGDPIWELRRINLTEAGEKRYEVLDQQQRERRKCTEVEVPPPMFGTARPFSASPDEGSTA